MSEKIKLEYDLVELMTTFNVIDASICNHLSDWMSAKFELDMFENKVLEDLYADIEISGEYMNEEELKARMVGLIFYASKLDVPNKIRVFYERPLTAKIGEHTLHVVADCMVATPFKSSPRVPYFFLQEYKKAKGEKRDPEAQMLSAMLIAQEKNKDGKPIYGGYMIGTGFHFSTLVDKNYCVSKRLEATEKSNLFQIVFILRKLRELILER
jgi:hypothetical protein